MCREGRPSADGRRLDQARSGQPQGATPAQVSREGTAPSSLFIYRLLNNMRVLSLFDGIGVGREALKHVPGIEYYASEICPHAIKVCHANHPDVTHVGDVRALSPTCVTSGWLAWHLSLIHI